MRRELLELLRKAIDASYRMAVGAFDASVGSSDEYGDLDEIVARQNELFRSLFPEYGVLVERPSDAIELLLYVAKEISKRIQNVEVWAKYFGTHSKLAQELGIDRSALKRLEKECFKRLHRYGVEHPARCEIKAIGDRAIKALSTLLEHGYAIEDLKIRNIDSGVAVRVPIYVDALALLGVYTSITINHSNIDTENLRKALRALLTLVIASGNPIYLEILPIGTIAYELTKRNTLRYTERVSIQTSS